MMTCSYRFHSFPTRTGGVNPWGSSAKNVFSVALQRHPAHWGIQSKSQLAVPPAQGIVSRQQQQYLFFMRSIVQQLQNLFLARADRFGAFLGWVIWEGIHSHARERAQDAFKDIAKVQAD